MRKLTDEEAAELGLRTWGRNIAPVELDEVKGATIAGLYMSDDPEGSMADRLVLVLSDRRCMVCSVAEWGDTLDFTFGTLGED